MGAKPRRRAGKPLWQERRREGKRTCRPFSAGCYRPRLRLIYSTVEGDSLLPASKSGGRLIGRLLSCDHVLQLESHVSKPARWAHT